MSINSKVKRFAQQELVLGRTATERDGINRSLSHLKGVLNKKIGHTIKDFLHFGSFTRNTILPRKYDPKSDVDLMVVFDTSKNSYTPRTYRKWLNDVVSEAYPTSISKKDFPVVKLLLNHIMFDIVPAKLETDWFTATHYIPNATGLWMKTNPNDLNSSLSNTNQSVGNNVTRNVIRLMKHWNASSGYPFESYLMEKEIIDYFDYFTFPIRLQKTTYESFLEVLNEIAGEKRGVRQALDYIKHYQGNIWKEPNRTKELQWVRKLLPGLN